MSAQKKREIRRKCGCVAWTEPGGGEYRVITSFDPGPNCFKGGRPMIREVRDHFGLPQVVNR